MLWVRLSKWCEQTGDTRDAVHARRRAGVWVDGVHCRIAPDGKLWVNTEAAQQWVESKGKENLSPPIANALTSC